MFPAFLALALASLLSLNASAADKAGVGKDVVLKGKGGHEECLKLKKGQELHYSFHANVAVDFNIHYHAGESVQYPVKKGGSRRHEASFQADSDREYCLMWENKGIEKAKLHYALKR